LTNVEIIKYNKKDFKLDELKEFLTPLARSTKKESNKKAEKKEENS
jgi:hypothetical protein